MRCSICGEPWDLDTLHDETSERLADGRLYARCIGTYPSGEPRYAQDGPDSYEQAFNAVVREFRTKGCETFSWASHNNETPLLCARTEALDTLYDLLGDDIDAIDAESEVVDEWLNEWEE